jgi:hypothetical protein
MTGNRLLDDARTPAGAYGATLIDRRQCLTRIAVAGLASGALPGADLVRAGCTARP